MSKFDVNASTQCSPGAYLFVVRSDHDLTVDVERRPKTRSIVTVANDQSEAVMVASTSI